MLLDLCSLLHFIFLKKKLRYLKTLYSHIIILFNCVYGYILVFERFEKRVGTLEKYKLKQYIGMIRQYILCFNII